MKRKKYSNELKSKVALSALKAQATTNEIASEFRVHPSQVNRWKKQAVEGLPDVFGGSQRATIQEMEKEKDRLYQQIGKLSVELDWLKKKFRSSDMSLAEKRSCIDPTHSKLSIHRQCELIDLSRSSYYRQPDCAGESEENLAFMRLIDEEYTQHPFYGSRQLRNHLQRQGHVVNRKRVQRLMRKMGIQSIAPGPNTSKPHPAHRIYPYLLRNLEVICPNQVWCSDITYLPLPGGFVYLVAVMDWYSRHVLSWEVSVNMESDFCVSALESALRLHGYPEIFNTDQGVQFTSNTFTGVLKDHDVMISMDGRGRAMDNIFIERLWRSVKHEEVYLKEYSSVRELIQSLRDYFEFYNYRRPHAGVGRKTPAEVYWGCMKNAA